MTIGVSTANLYPMNTEDALDVILSAGIKTVEIFLNTESESSNVFARELRAKADAEGAVIKAVHPYTSGSEPYWVFSEYLRRFEESLPHYNRIFEAAAIMGASYTILHGDKLDGVLSENESIIGRYEKLYDMAQEHGVTLLQENVQRFRASDISYIAKMRELLGVKAAFVFDLKQSIRCEASPLSIIQAMGDNLKHVHISDYNHLESCILPGHGMADYAALYDMMRGYGFDGVWILELYRKNFGTISNLTESVKFLENILHL